MSDLRSTLVQMLAGRANGGDAMSRVQGALMARLNQRPPGDPLRDAITQMLARNQPAVASQTPDPQVLLRAARDTLVGLQALLGTLAAALGACPDCWGTEPACTRCAGLGRSGWATPDRAAFATWVVPAVQSITASDTPDQKGEAP